MTKGGAAIPVKQVTTGAIKAGPAIPVYGYTGTPNDRASGAGPARPVYVVSDAELRQNGGAFVVAGDPQALPVYDAPAGMAVTGEAALPVYPINGWGASPYSFRDLFHTARAAGAINNTPAEPGAGTRLVTDTENKMTIAGGRLMFASGKAAPAWGDPQIQEGATITRSIGKALLVDVQVVGGVSLRLMFGFDAGNTGSIDTGHAIFFNDTTLTVTENNVSTSTGSTIAINTNYSLAVVLRSSGAFYFIKGGAFTSWTLLWVGYAVSTAALYRLLMLNNTNTGAILAADFFRQIELPSPYTSDYGIATQQLAGARNTGDAFSHFANCIIEWVVTTRVNGQQVYFRAQDALNYWRVDVAADGSIALQEVVGGGATSRGTGAAGSIANGQRMLVVADGQTIRVYANSVLKITYASAANFATATAGKLLALGAGGAISDIVSWPRTVPGGEYPATPPNFP